MGSGKFVNLRSNVPHTNGRVGRCSDDGFRFFAWLWMINNFVDFLRVAPEHGNNLLCLAIEDVCILIVATGQNLVIVEAAYVQCQDTRYTGRMNTLLNGKLNIECQANNNTMIVEC